jgi:antitoxin component YwqK of YwqJK toxin-antitoxin module
MNRRFSLSSRLVGRLVGFAATLAVCALLVSPASAADDDNDATIQKYDGPPLFLDEVETPPPASLVEKRVDSDKYPDGKLRYERQIARYSDDHYVSDGFYHEFYPNGEKFVEGQYKNGRQDGQWTYYHENGKVQRTVNFSGGQPDGNWEIFNAEGVVVAKRGYKAGKRDGTWVVFDESGKQPLREETYADGKADGTWKVWYPSGQQKTEIGIKAGVRDGRYAEWDEKGQQRYDLNFAEGKLDGPATLWNAEGKKIVQEYADGKLVKEAKE